VATALAKEWEAPAERIEADVLGFASEMVERRIFSVEA
jgi:hypothetical protein